MSTAFQAVINSVRLGSNDRKFGGTSPVTAADPYISGYHYIAFTTLPPELVNYISSGDGSIASGDLSSDGNIKAMLQGACLSVTPPGGTVNKTEFTGIGGIKWAVPTNVDYTNTVTVKFLEFSHLPILSIIGGWCRLIRDMKTGVSQLSGGVDSYTKSAYSGTMFYWTTKPDAMTVEYSACYTGMFPTKDPQDLFSGDVTAIDKLEIDCEFNVDWTWHEQWVHDKCQSFADTIGLQSQIYRGTNEPGLGTDASGSMA